MTESLWNLPRNSFENRAAVFWDIVAQHFGDRSIRALEIGVFTGSIFEGLRKQPNQKNAIASYTGVDPYLGHTADPYFGSYYADAQQAEQVFERTRRLFADHGAELVRTTSRSFFLSRPPTERWDLIFIDGDHRFRPCVWDLHMGLRRLAPGGLLIADDYANPDTPAVTEAVNVFLRLNEKWIDRTGYRRLEFQNQRKAVPISLTFVYLTPQGDPGAADPGDKDLNRFLRRHAFTTRVAWPLLKHLPPAAIHWLRRRMGKPDPE